MATEIVTIRLDVEQKKDLQKKAKEKNMSLGQYIMQGRMEWTENGEIPPDVYVKLMDIYNIAEEYDNEEILKIIEGMVEKYEKNNSKDN